MALLVFSTHPISEGGTGVVKKDRESRRKIDTAVNRTSTMFSGASVEPEEQKAEETEADRCSVFRGQKHVTLSCLELLVGKGGGYVV